MARLSFSDVMGRLLRWIQAGHPIIWINSHEEARVFDCLSRIVAQINTGVTANAQKKHLWQWTSADGLRHVNNLQGVNRATALTGAAPASEKVDWLRAQGLAGRPTFDPPLGRTTDSPEGALAQLADAGAGSLDLANSVAVFLDVHGYLLETGGASGSLVRPLRSVAEKLRGGYEQANGQTYKTVIIVAPSDVHRASELRADVVTLDFPLPEPDELLAALESRKDLEVDVSGFLQEQKLSGDERTSRLKELIAGAGCGLPLNAYKQGLNLIKVLGGKLNKDQIAWMQELKAETINNEALEYTPRVDVELGGLEVMEEWIRLRRGAATSAEVRKQYQLAPPKGVMLCGAAGGGKSQLAKLIARDFNLPLLRLDVGALFGSYVGESERRTREALRLAEALAPVVLWIDEIDKAFTGGPGAGDGGVGARVFGHFLTWLSEKLDQVFVVVTANDFRQLLDRFPEFGRKGRFDEIFWVGLPDRAGRKAIFDIYLGKLFDKVHPLGQKFIVGDLDKLRALWAEHVRDPLPDAQFRGLLLELLSHDSISSNMTGAEIEAAVNEALYKAFHQQGPLTPELLTQVVQGARKRSLYQNGTELEALRVLAEQRGWLQVPPRLT